MHAANGANRVRVAIADRETSRRAGLDGVLMSFQPIDEHASGSGVRVDLDYSAFASGNPAGWADRLELRQFPACILTTPEQPQCRIGTPLATRNDQRAGTVSAEVGLPNAVPTVETSAITTTQAPMTVLAAVAGTAGSSGDYKATSLTPSATWSAGGSSGGFTWAYPISLPDVPGTLKPGLTLTYSSSSVDGRTSATTAQPSAIGEGWGGLEQGYVERDYRSCEDDKGAGANNTSKVGDQCWVGDQYVTISLNGTANAVVKDQGTGGWKLQNDDGSRVEHLLGTVTDTANGDDGDSVDGANEYWRVTTKDGTQYWFGKNRLPGWTSGNTETNSVYMLPVYGNHAGEPGHQAAFASSAKNQAWRWMLDYVVDVHGNASAYFYEKEGNFYSSNAGTTADVGYTRGGYLTRIEYGHRAGQVYAAPAPAEVVFNYAERCLASCNTFDTDHKANWPDVPVDLNCDSGKTCYVQSPTFWSRKRLTQIETSVWSGTGTTYTPTDAWALEQTLPGSGDRGGAALWLNSITRTGKAPGSAPVTLPKDSFEGTLMANRVDGAEGLPPLYKYRVTRITSQAGADILVTYSAADCTTADLPTPDSNTRRCYPVWWTPDGYSEPLKDWFHKYVVTQVKEDDLVAGSGSPDVVTSYEYVGGAAWHRDEGELTKDEHRTWNQFRGYATVRTRVGVANPKLTEATYFRGMDGDKRADGTTRSVAVQGTVDRNEFAGVTREEVSYERDIAAGGTPSMTANYEPESVQTASRPRIGGLPDLTAAQTRVVTDTNKTRLSDGSWRTASKHRSFDSDGNLTTTSDEGDTAVTGDESCVRTTYVTADRSAWIVAYPASTQTASTTCEVAASPANITGETRTYYDAQTTLSAPPVAGQGNATKAEVLDRFEGSTPVFAVSSTTTFDQYGRILASTGEDGETTKTVYTPSAGRVPTSVSLTNPKGWTSVTTLDGVRGLPIKGTDANGRASSTAYDALGRLTGVWLNNRPMTEAADGLYVYQVMAGSPIAVTTKTRLDDGTYQSVVDIADGLLRTRQRQVQAPGGRVLTDSFYDDAGRAVKTNAGHFEASPPTNQLMVVGDAQIPSQTVVEFDGMGRPTASVFKATNVERWRTTTIYGGNWTATIPPAGGTSSLTVQNAQGQPTQLRLYKDVTPANGPPVPDYAAPASEYDLTSYEYDAAGRVIRVTDAAGKSWAYAYDLRGRETKKIDAEEGETTTAYVPPGQWGAGQIASTSDPRKVTLAYTYDQLGRQTSVRDGSTTGALRIETTYDTLPGALGFPVGTTRVDNGQRYTTEAIGYDNAGRATGLKVTIPAVQGEEKLAGTYTTTAKYTPGTGLLDTLTFGESWGGLPKETLDFGYTQLGQLNSLVSGTARYINGTVYSPFGEVTQTEFGNVGRRTVVTMNYAEDTRRLVQSTAQREKAGPQTLDALGYTYDQIGNVTRVVNKRDDAAVTDTQCFAYDYRRRLTDAWTAGDNCSAGPAVGRTPQVGGVDPYWTSYAFDAVGNRTSEKQHDPTGNSANDVTRTFNVTGHRLDSVDASGPGGVNRTSFGYDAAGNTVRRTVNGDDQGLTWDAEGHLASSTKNVNGVAQTSTYVYDGDGTRLLRRDPDAVTLYLGDSQLKLTRATNTVVGTRSYPGQGGTFIRTSDGKAFVTVADMNGTSQLSVDYLTLGYTRRSSMPYGDARGVQPSVWPDEKGFVGGTKDNATGLTHIGAREYDPTLGRFLSQDPLTITEDPSQLNPYTYGGDNPLANPDPSGMGFGSWVKNKAKSAAKAAAPIVKTVAVAAVVGVVVAAVVTASVVAAPVVVGGVAAAGAVSAAAVIGTEAGVAAASLYVAYDASKQAQENFAPKSRPQTETDNGCQKNSFDADTPVLMADGSEKPIEQVLVGDEVRAAEPNADTEVVRTVSAVHVTDEDKDFVEVTVETPDGPKGITSTAGHRFYDTTTQTWTTADELKVGDELQSPDGRVRIVAVRAYTASARTYNLTVDGVHTYFVLAGHTPVLVHNVGGGNGDCNNHLVLGINVYPYGSNHLAEQLNKDPNKGAYTLNDPSWAVIDDDKTKNPTGLARWMLEVKSSAMNRANVSITLNGLPGIDSGNRDPMFLQQVIIRAALRGADAGSEGGRDFFNKMESGKGYATPWEIFQMTAGSRRKAGDPDQEFGPHTGKQWSDIDWYVDGKKYDIPEPTWSQWTLGTNNINTAVALAIKTAVSWFLGW